MQNLRQLQKYEKGIGRFRGEASFATEGVVAYDESSANGGRKSLYKSKKSVGFQPLIVSFSVFTETEFFYFYFRLFRSHQM